VQTPTVPTPTINAGYYYGTDVFSLIGAIPNVKSFTDKLLNSSTKYVSIYLKVDSVYGSPEAVVNPVAVFEVYAVVSASPDYANTVNFGQGSAVVGNPGHSYIGGGFTYIGTYISAGSNTLAELIDAATNGDGKATAVYRLKGQ